MGQEKIKRPSTPEGWAARVSAVVKAAREIQKLPRFPIDVAAIAQDYSRNVFPDSPITLVEGEKLGTKFEGALVPNPTNNGEWGIFYNSSIKSKGRINFTLGHELGHYLLHRENSSNPIFCSRRDMWAWDSEYGKIEAEANRFASQLLMPPDDFRVQTSEFRRPTLAQFEPLRDRYEVSLTAAVLKWLEITTRRAMIVVSKDGFIDWSWSSPPLLKSGVYFKARQQTIPLPAASLAALGPKAATSEFLHPAGVWNGREPVFESVIFAEYHDMAISLLVYPAEGPNRWSNELDEEPALEDTFERFQR
ncbi:ImmA/IrrE family metallo-endopeptidase [Bradyrhizobium sp. URHD0069]|uniref:ImmA/IrrE family metallo-endopeptidase n=1 Tax=Bradyrhizobium sp. URHD0069 TaxID=1380355 RepID=UPI0009DE1194|nr:ImmA/IrrE family metallo-endopeptidase [Bradyrhizobium sp. URHD0069]